MAKTKGAGDFEIKEISIKGEKISGEKEST